MFRIRMNGKYLSFTLYHVYVTREAAQRDLDRMIRNQPSATVRLEIVSA